MLKDAINHGNPLILPEEYNTLSEMLIYIAEKYPHKGMTFIDSLGNEEFCSFSSLIDNALKYLKILSQKGLKPNDILILEIPNSKEFYNIFWACIFGGIIVAPVSQPASLAPGSDKLQKLFNIWKQLKKPHILIEEKYEKYYKLLKNDAEFSEMCFLSTAEFNSNERGNIHQVKHENLAILQFSSGTTGTLKGVQLSHKNILNKIIGLSRDFKLTEDDQVFTWLPHTHDMGLFAQYLASLISGCNIFIFSPSTFIRSPYLFLKKISEHRGTWFATPNFGLDWMAKNVPDEKLPSLDLSSVRLISNGAEPISVSVIHHFFEKFSKCGFRDNVISPCYGLAEATVGVTTSIAGNSPVIETLNRKKLAEDNVAAHVKNRDTNNQIKLVRVGYPFDGMSIRIADEEGNTLKEKMIGEIQIRGNSVTSGYINFPEANQKLFVDGWLRTGDLGYMINGSLVVTGRIKDILFVCGKNYFAHDLEEIVFNTGIVQRGNLVFVGLFNHKTEQEELLAFVKNKSSIEEFLHIRKMIIDRLHESLGMKINYVIPVTTIPKTTSGKLQRVNLRKCYENGDYNDLIEKINKCIDKNLSDDADLEKTLCRIWSKILEIPESKITIDDEFFALGGNSIKAFQMLNEIELYLNREIGLESLVVCKTIKQFIDYLKTAEVQNNKSYFNCKSDRKLDPHRAIAITGMALRLPGAKTLNAFWDNLCSKKDCVRKVSFKRNQLSGHEQWNDWLGELEDIDYFDNDFFDISSEEAVFMDPQQRLILETSYEALDDAGLTPGLDEERNIGVYSSISANTYYELLLDYLKTHGVNELHQNTMMRSMSNMASALIARTFNFTGPALVIDTACSSFLVALHHAVLALRQNNIMGAVVTGANILATPVTHMLLRKAGILSPTAQAKVFDKDADGTVVGEGIVVFYLETLKKAIEGRKNIYGVIRGTAINNDGRSFGIMTPNPKKQHKVLLDTYHDANVSPNEISYIEVHGTGTAIGDPIEINTLSKVFSEFHKTNNHTIGIGSVKTNIGHLLPAAGGAGLAKVLLSLKHQKLIPSLHLKNLNPALKLDKSPFYVVKEVEAWNTKDGKSRKSALSSFGLGGTNAHIILEEWVNDVENHNHGHIHLLTFSAKSKKALEEIIKQTKELIVNNSDLNINDLCYTRNRYRKHYCHRAAFLISHSNEIQKEFFVKENHFKNKAASVGIIANNLTKWSLIVENLKQITNNIVDVVDINSSQSSKKCDVVISLGVSEEYLKKMISNETTEKIKIISVEKDVKADHNFQWFSLIGELYINGVDFNWSRIHSDGSGKLINLPCYPFEKKSFWINSLI